MNQQIVVPQANNYRNPPVVINYVQQRYMTIPDIYLLCDAPEFQSCQCCAGCLTCLFSGLGLVCFPCYGAHRLDCCNVTISGVLMMATFPCVWGFLAGCCVGCKMLCT